MAAVVVWLMQASSAACERLDLLHGVLRSSLDAWKGVLKPVEEIACVGWTASRLRWGECRVAPRAERKVPVGSWMLSEGVWRLGLGSGDLWRELVDVVISSRN